jgi:PAS domain S-box-containing protein
MKRKDGSIFPSEHSVSQLLNDKGEPTGWVSVVRDITERKLADQKLQLQSQIAENMFEGVVLTRASDGVIVYANPRFEEMLGYGSGELNGKNIAIVNAPTSGKSPDEIAREIQTTLKETGVWSGEVLNVKKDGTPIWCRANVSTLESSQYGEIWVDTHEDITERKRMEEEIRNLARFPSENPNPILRLGSEGTVLSTNDASKELLQHWNSGIGRAAPKSWRDMAADALSSGRSRNIDIELGDKSYTFLVKPIVEDGYVNLYGRDITERKRAEEALRRRAEELAALQATVLDITGSHDLPILLQTIIERAARLIGAPAGGIYLCDHEKQEARCVVSYNTPHDYTGTTLKYGQGAAGIVAQTGRPLIIDDYRSWQGRATVYEKEQPFTAVLTVPMIWQDRVTGVIHVLDDTASRRFTQADQELLTLFANHAAIAVENARLLGQEKHHAEELTHYSTKLERLVSERTSKLAESEKRYRELADLLPQIVFEIDENGNLQFMNRAAFALSGRSKEEFRKGLNAFDLFVPEEHERAVQGIRRIMAGETISGREFTLVRRDGTTCPVLVYTAPVMCEGKAVGLRGIAIDIAERRKMEEELREARERLEYLITSNPAVIYSGKPLADLSDWDLTYLSPRIKPMLGFEPWEFIGHPDFWKHHVHPEDLRHTMAQVPRFWNEGQRTFEYRFLHKDGTYRWIREEARVTRDPDGKPIEVNGYWIDVTERKRLEEALAKSQRLATIGELAAMVGHDLRNPLQGIAGAAYYLRTEEKSKLSNQGKAMIRLIQESIEDSDKIINDLVEYSRELHLELSRTNVKSITKDALAKVKIPKGVRVVNSTKNQPPMKLDVHKMRRVFMNLIRNAFDAMPNGGTLTITSSRSGDNLHITFEDTGEGMTTETLAKLWSPLFTTKAKGMGLGLAIIKRFVEAHEGSIDVESKPGKGSTFTVTLPIKRSLKGEEVKKK